MNIIYTNNIIYYVIIYLYMEELENKEVTENNLEKSATKKWKKMTIVIIILFLVVLFSAWYAYHVGTKNTSTDATIIKKIQTWIQKTVEWKNDDVNYSFFVKWNVEIIDNWDVVDSWKIDIIDGKILSTHKGLQQRVQLWSVDVNVNSKNNEENYSLKNLDLVSNNEKVYFFLEEGMDMYTNLMKDIQIPSQLHSKIEPIFKSGSYVMVDNAKPLLNIFGNLTENELMRELLIGLATSNPQAYYQSNWTDQKIAEYLSSDEILNYIFSEGETNTVTNQTPLSLNTAICNDYAPVVLRFVNDFYASVGIDMGSMSPEEMIPICEQQIVTVNTYLPMILQISKEGDIINWNYSFIMAQWNMFSTKISYKNNVLDTWYTSIQDPKQQFSGTINGDKKWVLSSNLKINFETPEWTLSGSIIDWTWKISIQWEQEDIYKIDWIIEFQKYIVTNYDITWNMDQFWTTIDLIAKWNLKKGDIKYSIKQWEQELIKLALDYLWLEHNLDIHADTMKLSSVFKDKKYDLSYQNEWYYGEKEEMIISYNAWKINWSMIDSNMDINIDWDFNSYSDFKISLLDNKHGDNVKISWTWDLDSNLIYTYEWENEWVKGVEIVAKLNKTKENWSTVLNLQLEWGLLNKTNKIKEWMNLDLSIGYQEGKAEYKIPTNVEELDISVMEIMNLPNISSLKSTEINTQTYIIVWVTGWAVLGTVAFISLQWYSQDAKNSKITSDTRTLTSAIETSLTMWRVTYKDLVLKNSIHEWESVTVNGTTVLAWEGYSVGTINFSALGQNWNDFKHPDGSDYIIWVVASGSIARYQVMGITQEDKYTKSAVVKWNYYQAEENDSEGLIFINGKAVVNRQVIDIDELHNNTSIFSDL